MDLPFLTADLPGIGGRLKVMPQDFYVEEIPLYPPAGEGQHVFVEIEKTGLSTYAAVRAVAQALKISPSTIGHAGLKDARAITRQTISIDKVTPEAVAALNLPNVKILSAKRHYNKLRTGHLAGNRFVIRIRDVNQKAIPAAEVILTRLSECGVPNFFGAQRFGHRGNTGRLGELLIRGDEVEFVAEHLGRPQLSEAPNVQSARKLVDEGRWAEALRIWPRQLSDERRIVAAISQAGGRVDVAFGALNNKLKSLFVSAFQSELFNALLIERLTSIDQLEDGDIAYIHGKGASFMVRNSVAEQPRADRFEISPSGPLFGQKTLLAEGRPGERERAILSQQNLVLEDFAVSGLKIRGGRRPYRFELKDSNLWWDQGLMVSFELQPGAYATMVMAEIMKN